MFSSFWSYFGDENSWIVWFETLKDGSKRLEFSLFFLVLNLSFESKFELLSNFRRIENERRFSKRITKVLKVRKVLLECSERIRQIVSQCEEGISWIRQNEHSEEWRNKEFKDKNSIDLIQVLFIGRSRIDAITNPNWRQIGNTTPMSNQWRQWRFSWLESTNKERSRCHLTKLINGVRILLFRSTWAKLVEFGRRKWPPWVNLLCNSKDVIKWL